MTDDCGPLYTVASFAGIKQQESGSYVPDTMGAVGPNHFMVLLNGQYSVAVYDKHSGIRRSPTTTMLSDFFALTVPSGPYAGNYPTVGAVDPRILYDHGSQRWIASALDSSSGHVLLAVSHGSDPVGNGGSTWVPDNWTKYLVPFGPCYTDYDTLGVDSNGIYICVRQTSCSALTRVAALPKGPFINGSAQTVQNQFILDVTEYGGVDIQPAVNFDPITTDEPAWFLFEAGNVIFFNRLKWVNGFTQAPEWQEQPSPYWGELIVNPSFYDLNNGRITAPQLTGSDRVFLNHQGSKLMMAMARKIGGTQFLWTCHQIGVNSAGNNDDDQADRSAVAWFKIQTAPTFSITQSNRIYDTATTTPNFYYMPSLVVNKNGDMVVGFSSSSANDYIGACYTGKLNNGSSPNTPIRYFAGKDWVLGSGGTIYWGDYSYTSLDPDGLKIWTIQEYAETRYLPGDANAWGTRIAAITPF